MTESDKKNFNIIIRGFSYKENWIPLSTRRHKTERYTINIIDNIHRFEKLITNLSKKYNVTTYLSTYNTTPKKILDEACDRLKIDKVILSEEKNSKQFTTAIRSLEEIQLSGLTLLIRADLIKKDKLIELISNYDFDYEHIYALCLEKNGSKISDFFHIIPDKKIPEVKNFLKNLDMRIQQGHYIHQHINTKTMISEKITFPTEYYEPYDSRHEK